MALQVLQFVATIPAGTQPDTPAVVPLDVDNWDLEQLDLEVPPGPTGLMGFAVFNNGVQWVPRTPGTWLVWDDNQQSWPLTGQPNGSGWQIVGYNTGAYDHAVIARFHVNPPAPPPAPTTMPSITIVTSAPPALEPVTLQ